MPELLRAATRVVRNPVVDSRRWDDFTPRDDDIVIGTFRKCGTTWTQRIIDLLVFQSPEVRPFGDISPWLDATVFNSLEEDLATLEAQTHRRHRILDGIDEIWKSHKKPVIYTRNGQRHWRNITGCDTGSSLPH